MAFKTSQELVEKTNAKVIQYFREISQIPRGSGNERVIADYLVAFAEARKDRHFTYQRSKAVVEGKQTHDVLIRVPASKGYEHLEPVILQSHIDMVCQKTTESKHDFTKDPITLIEKDGMMTGDNTTLGADDGIGVASALAIIDDEAIMHPAIEALFTSDEEDGMTGATAVSELGLTANRLINIDTETEGVMYYGCAGGLDANFSLPLTLQAIPSDLCCFKVEVSGLTGGHSGVEIHNKRANAHKLLARTVRQIEEAYADKKIYLYDIVGGDKRNVITKQASICVAVAAEQKKKIVEVVSQCKDMFLSEYNPEGAKSPVEPELNLTATALSDTPKRVYSPDTATKLIDLILAIPNDVQAMHCGVDELVETSCNLGIITQTSAGIELCSLIRSFYQSKKLYVAEQMRILAKHIGAGFSTSSDYPNWNPNLESALISRFAFAYKQTFRADCDFQSIHAGLECGYFSEQFPHMDMIACGPTITGAHTPKETLDISSTEKVVELLMDVLGQMAEEVPQSDAALDCVAPKHTHTHTCQCMI